MTDFMADADNHRVRFGQRLVGVNSAKRPTPRAARSWSNVGLRDLYTRAHWPDANIGLL
jgi:hypothetical protein